jgi:hypothetical protein
MKTWIFLALGWFFGSSKAAEISNSNPPLPSNGFLHGILLNQNQNLTLKLKSFNHLALSAASLTFNDLPIDSRFKSPVFKLVPNQYSFNRPVWSNGREYLYFIMNPDDGRATYGTWLVGKEIGIDSGLAYLKPKRLNVIPLGEEMEGTHWHLLGKTWTPNESITLSTSSSIEYLDYYEVEYLKGITLSSSIFLLTSPPANLPTEILKNVLELSIPEVVSIPPSKLQYPAIWSSSHQSWKTFSLTYAIPLASPVILSKTKSISSSSSKHQFQTTSSSFSEQETIGHLITDEYLETGWRLSFRLTDSGKELELMIALDNNGLQDGFLVTSTTPPRSYQIQLNEKFKQMEVGDYAWVWFEMFSDPHRETTNLILRCIHRDKDQIIFEYFQSDRRDAMSRSMLSHSISYVVAKRILSHSSSPSTSSPLSYRLFIDDEPLRLLTLFQIGSNPVQWIADYLLVHENALAPGLSSCFMYHAGTTIPQQFIYAAEIICFLLGAKPITMVFPPLSLTSLALPFPHLCFSDPILFLLRSPVEVPFGESIDTRDSRWHDHLPKDFPWC